MSSTKPPTALFRAKQRTAYGTAYLVDRTHADEFVRAAWERGLTRHRPLAPLQLHRRVS